MVNVHVTEKGDTVMRVLTPYTYSPYYLSCIPVATAAAAQLPNPVSHLWDSLLTTIEAWLIYTGKTSAAE